MKSHTSAVVRDTSKARGQQARQMDRRRFFRESSRAGGALAVSAAVGVPCVARADFCQIASAPDDPYRYCLNAALILNYRLDIVQQVELAASTGYQAVEPWLRDLAKYQEAGGKLSDLKKRIADLGLTVESAIAFAPWIVDDPQKRADGVEQMKKDMDVLRRSVASESRPRPSERLMARNLTCWRPPNDIARSSKWALPSASFPRSRCGAARSTCTAWESRCLW